MCQKTVIHLLILFVCCITAGATSARPYTYNYRVFIGGDLQRSFFSGKKYGPVYLTHAFQNGFLPTTVALGAWYVQKWQLRNHTDGETIYVGYNMYNFGLQAGYTHLNSIVYPNYSAPTVKGSSLYVKQKGRNLFLDLQYFWQISKRNVIKGIVGVGALKTSLQLCFISTESLSLGYYYTFQIYNTRISPRIGVAWQFNMDHNWSTDISYKYQMGNALFSYMQTVAISLSYYLW